MEINQGEVVDTAQRRGALERGSEVRFQIEHVYEPFTWAR